MKTFSIFLIICISCVVYIQSFADANVHVHFNNPIQQVKPLILGNNVQWIDYGDGILEDNTLNFDSDILELTQNLGTSVLRYPGGTYSDTYHWENGIGDITQRGFNQGLSGDNTQQVLFGTDEFLEFAYLNNAQTLITINIHTGTPQEAADWVRYTNIDRVYSSQGVLLPKVALWEIGNEPYLYHPESSELDMMPEEYAQRVNEFIQAMKAVDPNIYVGIPMRSDIIGGNYATPYQGFNDTILQTIDQDFEFVALHNAYIPFVNTPHSSESLYLSTMAGSKIVAEDIQATRELLDTYYPNQNIPITVTEYNTFYQYYDDNPYMSSLTSALYIADLMRVFSEENIAMAQHWSLIGNWLFGAINTSGNPTPSYHFLSRFSSFLQGNIISSTVTSDTFDSPAVGFTPALTDIPVIESLVTQQGITTQILLINKDIQDSQKVKISFDQAHDIGLLSAIEMYEPQYFSSNISGEYGRWKDVPVILTRKGDIKITMKPHSMVIITVNGEDSSMFLGIISSFLISGKNFFISL